MAIVRVDNANQLEGDIRCTCEITDFFTEEVRNSERYLNFAIDFNQERSLTELNRAIHQVVTRAFRELENAHCVQVAISFQSAEGINCSQYAYISPNGDFFDDGIYPNLDQIERVEIRAFSNHGLPGDVALKIAPLYHGMPLMLPPRNVAGAQNLEVRQESLFEDRQINMEVLHELFLRGGDVEFFRVFAKSLHLFPEVPLDLRVQFEEKYVEKRRDTAIELLRTMRELPPNEPQGFYENQVWVYFETTRLRYNELIADVIETMQTLDDFRAADRARFGRTLYGDFSYRREA